MKKMEMKKLTNGVRVILKPLQGLKAVTFEVMVGVGSKYEKPGEHGLSHFLEHMMFKGTTRRPTAEIINKEVDAKGAISNAGTGQEITSYYITTVSENRQWAIGLLSDILINSKFEEQEINKERNVIAEEIKMYQDNPMSGLSSDFMEHVWGGSKIGCWNISGEVGEVLRYKQKEIIDYWKKYYLPERIVVVVAGDLKGDELEMIENSFGVFTTKSSELMPEVTPVWTTKPNKVIKRQNEQGHFVMGLPGIKSNDTRKYEFKILDIILSGNSSSRLSQKVREDKGLAYYIYSVSESLAEVGVWAVQSGVIKSRIDEAMEIVKTEMINLPITITDDEVLRAKDYVKGKTKLAMDRADFWTSFLGEKLLLENKLVELEDELSRLSQVSLSRVLDLATDLTRARNFYTLKLK